MLVSKYFWSRIAVFKYLQIYNTVQLNKYKTDPYFLQIFQICLIISVFCKSCEPICEPEIVLNIFAADFQANPTDINT